METQIFKTAFLLVTGAALTATLVACGDSSKGDSKVQSGLGNKAQDEKEFTGEPGTAEQMVDQTYRLKTDKQEFVLKKLAHLVWAKFECTAKLTDGDKTTDGLVTVSFYPTLDIKTVIAGKEKIVVSPTEACGRKLTTEKTPTIIPTGELAKDENNRYNLQYGFPGTTTSIVAMNWDAEGKDLGEITCATEDGKLSKAVLTACTIVPTSTPATLPEPTTEEQH